MTRQYKSVEEDLMNQINILNKRKLDNQECLKQLEDRKKEQDSDIKEISNSKTEQINKLKNQIEQMSSEFSDLLSGVLDSMKSKIHDANEKWDQENDNAMLKRFEEYTNTKQ